MGQGTSARAAHEAVDGRGHAVRQRARVVRLGQLHRVHEEARLRCGGAVSIRLGTEFEATQAVASLTPGGLYCEAAADSLMRQTEL